MFIKFFNLVLSSPQERAFLFSMPDYFTQVFYIVGTMSRQGGRTSFKANRSLGQRGSDHVLKNVLSKGLVSA